MTFYTITISSCDDFIHFWFIAHIWKVPSCIFDSFLFSGMERIYQEETVLIIQSLSFALSDYFLNRPFFPEQLSLL